MAEQGSEQPELEGEVEDMEDEEVVEAAGSLPINQMALTLGRLRDRLKHATGGAVVMDALLDDTSTPTTTLRSVCAVAMPIGRCSS